MENLTVDQDQDEIIIKCNLEEMAKAFFKDYEIIWHDPNVNSQENQQYLAQLETLCPVQTFTKWKEAEDYIKTAKTVCHMITPGTNRELLVKEIFSSQNVPRIFSFCQDEEYQVKYNEKILCTEAKIEDVIAQIQKNLLGWHKQTSSLKFDLPAFAPIFNDWDKSQMNHLHHYLKVIPNFHNRAEAKKDFVDLSKRLYLGQRRYEKEIKEFEDTYNHYNIETILRWYTRPTFLHKVINNSLRLATSDSIQYCRFVLKDLERAIKEQYQKKSKEFSGLLYRGAYFSEEEWSSLKANVNREIEMHGFLSVSKDQETAWKFINGDLKKIFITIIVPKGPNEEEQGFAEVEELSLVPKEKEILFNVRSRFTVLETEEEYSQDLPYHHLVLLYGAQGLRKYITEKSPVQQISIENVENILCFHCKISTGEMTEKWLFMPIVDPEKQIYFCRSCLDKSAVPLLSIPPAEKVSSTTIEIKGCLLTNSSQKKIPLYGYRCSKCGAKNQERYFICTDCGERGKRWCENCFGEILSCTKRRHTIILENYPFSFWCERMSENELNHLKFQNDFVENGNYAFPQAEMYLETHENEKAMKFYKRYIVQNKSKCRDRKLAFAYSGLGQVYLSQGKYLKAVEYHLKSLDILKSVHGEYHHHVAASYRCIGRIYDEQEEHAKALGYHSKSLEILKKVYGESRPDVAESYKNIGLVFGKQGEYIKALEHHLKSLDIYKSVYGENHPAVAETYNSIGLVYRQREYMKALEYYFKSLDIFKSIYGENHPNVSISYNNIGSLYSEQGEHAKALEYHLKSLEVNKSVYGENQHHVAISYRNIGLIYYGQGEHIEALEYLWQSLEIFKSVHGANHPDVASSYNKIGEIYNNQGEHAKALEYCLKSLDIYKSLYEENHPAVAESYKNIGLVFDKQGEYTKALEHHLKSLDIYKSVYGEDHPDLAFSYSNIGFTYGKQAEDMKALEYLWKSLNIFKSVYGENHPAVASIYIDIGLRYENQREHAKALEYYLKSLDIRKSVYGEDHPDVAFSYYLIGFTYGKQAEDMKALEYLWKSLDIFKSVYGENHFTVATSYYNIGLRYDNQREHAKALEYYLKSLDIRKVADGKNYPDVSDDNIGMTNGEQGEYMKALEYHLKAMDIYKSQLEEYHEFMAVFYHSAGFPIDKQEEQMIALKYLSDCLNI